MYETIQKIKKIAARFRHSTEGIPLHFPLLDPIRPLLEKPLFSTRIDRLEIFGTPDAL
jgi:hypothetical protein